jgi:hypothetical protein
MDHQHGDEPGSTGPERHDLERQDLGPGDVDGSDLESVEGLADGPDEVTTGVNEVDAVLASLEGLDGRPVAEHVEVFEKAHERLRRALDTPAD